MIALVFVVVLGGSIGAIVAGAQNGGATSRRSSAARSACSRASAASSSSSSSSRLAIALLYLVWVPLALRYAVLMDRPAVKAIGDGWRLIRSRFRDVALAGVTLWAISIALRHRARHRRPRRSSLPAVGFAIARIWAIPALLFAVFLVVAVFAGSVFSAFYSSAWTIAFRRITGLGSAPPAAASVAERPRSGSRPGAVRTSPARSRDAARPAPPAPPSRPCRSRRVPDRPPAPRSPLRRAAGPEESERPRPAGPLGEG